MKNKEDLLNLGEKKSPKKFLIYSAIAFLVFVIGVIVFALFSGNEKKENNEVIPPQVKEEPIFKEIPIEEPKQETSKEIEKPQQKQKEPEVNVENRAQEVKKLQNIPKKENTEKTLKPAPKKIEKKSKQTPKKSVANGKYYVQVAALMKSSKPNKNFLNLLKKHGYNYIIYPVEINKNGKKIKINKLLVGPFNSREEAKKELIKIKKYITQNAFVFKVSK